MRNIKYLGLLVFTKCIKKSNFSFQENGKAHAVEDEKGSQEPKESNSIATEEPKERTQEQLPLEQNTEDSVNNENGNVKKLALVLDKIMTFKVNPENGERICDKKV